MRFMMMMHAPRGTGVYAINDWSPEDFKAHMAFMHSFNREMADAGERVMAEGLAAPGAARLIRAGKGGAPATDGPFAESKEFLVGFWIVEVDSIERAVALAAKASTAPGPGGVPLNMPIELRQVMSGPSPDA